MTKNGLIASALREDLLSSDGDERMRGWLKLAQEQGKKLQSLRTGLIHGGTLESNEDLRLLVPIVDNIAYALLLLRTRHTEQIQEAKILLQRILHWQSVSIDPQENGNYPVYLHDFPSVYDRYSIAALLPYFYRIASEYESVLGNELKEQFRHSCTALIANGLLLLQEKEESLPLPIRMKLAAALAAFGSLWKVASWESFGQAVLERVFALNPLDLKLSPQLLGEFFIGFSLYYLSLQDIPWKGFAACVNGTWDAERGCYCGPGLCLNQYLSEPQVGIYDLFWALSTGSAPSRLLHYSAGFYLQTALVYPWLQGEEAGLNTLEGSYHSKWVCHKKEHFTLSYCQGATPEDPAKNYTYHPLRIVLGDGTFANSLVCQAPPGVSFSWNEEGESLIGEVKFLKDFGEGDKESSRELIFAWNRREGIQTAVLEQPASLFFLEQPVQVRLPEGTWHFSFESEEKGAFTGHLIPGNRWSQVGLKGEKKYEQYDGLLFLRTLHREVDTKIKFKMMFKTLG